MRGVVLVFYWLVIALTGWLILYFTVSLQNYLMGGYLAIVLLILLAKNPTDRRSHHDSTEN
jgi:hypothetical protein